MPVYLPSAVVGNNKTLITLGNSGEIMGWFYPAKDHAQQIHECLPAVYLGEPNAGHLSWTWSEEWTRRQSYESDSNLCTTKLSGGDLEVSFCDLTPEESALLIRQITIRNISHHQRTGCTFLYGDWSLGGVRTGNGARYEPREGVLLQTHRDVSLAVGGDGVEMWQCGKAGDGWHSNARDDLNDGALQQQNLEIGDVNWAVGFHFDLAPNEIIERLWLLSLGQNEGNAIIALQDAKQKSFEQHANARREADALWLAPGMAKLKRAGGEISQELQTAYKRSLLCLPLLCGEEGVAIAAPEFDPEFISCGGYGYFWPRDGAEYVSGLHDAGYFQFAEKLFDWCAAHQDESGLWHQRYFLNGSPAPNWCLPPELLQIDQVGAILWRYGKYVVDICGTMNGGTANKSHNKMVRRAADYLLSRLTEKGVHANAFDTWETFVGSFTYSNASLYAAFRVAKAVLCDPKYEDAARRVKEGVLQHFVRTNGEYSYLVRGFNSHGENDETIDSSSLGAIEPFALLDLNDDADLALAEGTMRAICERLECDWEGGRAIRRFEGDAYVGGVPACVNTLWLARCALKISSRLHELNRTEEAENLTSRAEVYLATVLRRATPTGLLPELMQGPEGQKWWAAPHGWAMASFVSGVLLLAQERAKI